LPNSSRSCASDIWEEFEAAKAFTIAWKNNLFSNLKRSLLLFLDWQLKLFD